MPQRRRLALLGAVLSLAATPALAQTPAADGVLVFAPDFFAAARPADAYDMIRRLPGFTLIEGDEDVRGFGGARGNVLIDGRAPASKEQGLAELLRRIPAGSVERIELVRGGARGIDMAGYDVIANVVRRRVASTRGAAEFGAWIAEDGLLREQGRIELSHENGERRIEAALALATEVDDESGRGRLVEIDTAGNPLSDERRRQWEVDRTVSGSLDYATPLLGGALAAHASLAREANDEDKRRGDDRTATRERVWRGEASGSFRRALGPRDRIEIIGLHRFNRLRALEREEDERFAEATDLGESVLRAEYRRDDPRLALNASIEGAINALDSETALERGGVEVPLPGSDARVTERRGEAALGATWQATPSLLIEPSLRAEVSSIRAAGDSGRSLSLFYWKPRVSVATPVAGGQARLVAERSVGQLDFDDFVSSASLDRGDVSAGAQSLRPPATWSAGATWERRFWGDGALILSYRHEWIADVIDRVAVEADGKIFDAVGNIGGGRRHVGHAELTLPFGRLGTPGMQLRASATLIRSRVTDPVTGHRRIISEDRPFEADIGLVHDIPGGRWSWGADLGVPHHEWQFRFDEVRLERKAAMLDVHVEFRPSSAWRIRFEARDLTTRRVRETRWNYAGSRALGAVESIEHLSISSTPIFVLTVRRAFGGGR
jgi:hypothetical protein